MRSMTCVVVLALALGPASAARGQSDDGMGHPPDDDAPASDSTPSEPPSDDPPVSETNEDGEHVEHGSGMAMEAEGEGGLLPMGRDGSGTSWLPDSTPVRAFHLMAGGWRIMLHGDVTLGYDWQGTTRGDDEVISTNWFMAMASRDVLGGELALRAMTSLEPLTASGDGYPLLLQTGESFEGEELIDRQHPHDLVMELAARYRRPIAGGVGIELYGGPAGEPALGPSAFPHRASASGTPLAPLGHHWLDSTHITYGVTTVGLMHRVAKLEASWFNGQEPDEERYDLDLRGFDSYSARLSVNLGSMWSAQVSRGRLAEPEALAPGVAVDRTTASLSHNHPFGKRNLAAMLAWGRNDAEDAPPTDAFLLESTIELGGHLGTTLLRLEVVEKTGEELALGAGLEGERFMVHNLTVGHLHELSPIAGFAPGLGLHVNIAHLPDEVLANAYDSAFPVGVYGYLLLRPAAMKTAAMTQAP